MAGNSAWSVRPFRWLWAASGLSLLGSELGDLAIPLFALLFLEASPADLASIRVAQFTPFLLLTLALGVIVDRVRRRPLLIVADTGRGLLLLAIVTVALLWTLPVWWLVVVAFAIGSLTVLYQLADFSFLPTVVPRHQLADANAKISATQSAMTVAGNGAGGLAVQLLTAPFAIVANAGTYLASAALLSRVRADESAEREARRPGTSVWTETKQGVRFLARDRVVRALAGEAGTWNLCYEILLLSLTLHVMATFAYGAATLGALLMLAGLGGFTGAWLSGRVTRRFGYGRSLLVTLLVGNTAPLALSLSHSGSLPVLVLYAAALTLSGFGVGLANAQAVTVRQLATPPGMRGRVNAAYRFISWGMIALGAVAAGGAVTLWGPATGMLVGAAGMATATGWVAFSPLPSLRHLDDRRGGQAQQEPAGVP